MQDTPDIVTHFQSWFNIGVSIAAVLTGALGGILAAKFRKYKKKLSTGHFYDGLFICEDTNRTQIGIHEKIAIYRSEVGADRVTVAQFHNGGEFLDGTAMKKFSVTYETVTSSTSLEGPKTQNILLSMMWTIVQHITLGTITINSVKDCDSGTYLHSWLQSRGTQYYTFSPIKKNEQHQGFILVEWLHTPKILDDKTTFEEKTTNLKSQIEIDLFMSATEKD